MRRYLKQTWSGHIYVWSEALAKRDDMEEIHAPPPPPPCPAPEAETPTQNPQAKPELPPLDEAISTFRKEAGKPPRRKGEA